MVATVDTMVEGIDFRLDWPGFDFRVLGRRLMSVNLSDLAAMGAQPRHALVSLALPRTVAVEDVRRLYRGISERARVFGCTLAGGDLSSTPGPITLTAALYGVLPSGAPPLQRHGARAGWSVAVTGVLGRAGAGLELLLVGKSPTSAPGRRWMRALYDPQPRLKAAHVLRLAGVRICGDISDGVFRDVERIAEAAGVGATLEAAALPVDVGVRTPSELIRLLASSEDYELVCAAPARTLDVARRRLWDRLQLPLTTIGTLTATRGIRLRLAGREFKLAPSPPLLRTRGRERSVLTRKWGRERLPIGYEHFR